MIKELLQKGINSSQLVKIELPDTQSEIVKENDKFVFCFKLRGLKGLFRKMI
jgi:hypothetical protein